MRILSIEIQDILSIQKASLLFEDTGLVLIEGWNYDTQRANGAGKTAIFNCLSFALYDKLPRKITASEIVRRGCKTGLVKCSILCGDDTWTVERTRPKGVKFLKNNIEQNISQEEFESFIRLTYQQFLLTIYTPQANSGSLTRFLNSPDTLKKEFLLQLLNLDQFSDIKKKVDELVKQQQASIDILMNKLSTARARIETYEESLIDVDSISNNIRDLQQSMQPLNGEILNLADIQKPDLSKYYKIEEDIKNKQLHIVQSKTKRTLLHDKYRELMSSIVDFNSSDTCLECGSKLDVSNARELHSEHQKKIIDKANSVKIEIDSIDIAVLKEKEISDLANKLRDKKQLESSSYQDAQIRLNELNSIIRAKKLQIEALQSKLDNNSTILLKINNLQQSIEQYNNDMLNYRQFLSVYKTLSSIYSPTGAQAYVLDSVVDSFNEVIQKYIDLLASNMTYTLNSFKENAKGDVVAKFSETLTKNGIEISVGSLSGGEEKGLSLCVDFALLEVLETQFGMTLNPIILDEPFDGLDITGKEIVIDLLENLAHNRQIFIIDHSSEAKSMFSKVIKVNLRNHISSISIES